MPLYTNTITAAIVSAALRDYKTSIVLAIVISINTVIGFYQARPLSLLSIVCPMLHTHIN